MEDEIGHQDRGGPRNHRYCIIWILLSESHYIEICLYYYYYYYCCCCYYCIKNIIDYVIILHLQVHFLAVGFRGFF
jgi:hypothetical protein